MSETPTAPTPLAAGDVCTRAGDQVPYLGAPCPVCGHTTAAHPGTVNPALDECVLCRVQVSIDDLVALTGGLETGLEVVSAGLARLDQVTADQVARADQDRARLESLERVVEADERDVLALADRVSALEAGA